MAEAGGAAVENASAFVVLGKVVDAWGIAGALKIHPFADDPVAWAKLPVWWLGREEQVTGNWRECRLRRGRVHGESVVVEFDGVADRNAAEALKGMLVGVPRSALPPARENEYYWADLIGLQVLNTRDEPLGRVLGLIETGANDVLRVGVEGEPERLLPFVAAVVLSVDIGAGCIRVDWEADW
ncbi:ribosome maturation factor RimM [Rhodocyclus tenuis]|uniref:Ribosome maturation factor RimM n=1 Tax=Rhodocyclus tenuis TaxID=1066 RepID=A0A840G2Y0_RHOTE|nr:ribosome maturation factor RimM [Rhodocyclus tenuis]MBB4246763.1 16S rRNA processing protein RimM [Rhodocyclus tenuis]